MAELSADEMANIWGRLGYRDAFDSCNDPDGSEIYAHWAAQEAYLDYRTALLHAVNQHAALSNKASTPEQARQQAATCQIDPLFVNMMSSPNFKAVSQYMMEQSNKTLWEYGDIYYEDDNFGRPFTQRNSSRIELNALGLYSILYGRGDVFIHTHPGPGVAPGLSNIGGDISFARDLSIAIMAIDISDPRHPQYYCYNPSRPDGVL